MGKIVRILVEKSKIDKPMPTGLNTKIPPIYTFALGVIFVMALIVRLYPVIGTTETAYRYGFGIFGDTELYHVIAYNLYKGNGFSGTDDGRAFGLKGGGTNIEYEPAITRGPVYPFFISMVYKIFGSEKNMESIHTWRINLDKVRIVQCFMDAFVCILVFLITFLICQKSFFPAIISALLYCFSFYNIFYSRALLSECVTTFLLTLMLLFCILSLKYNKIYYWILAGICLGLTTLSRPEYLFFTLVFAFYTLIVGHRHILNVLKKSLIFVVATAIIIAPWTVRNYLTFKKPILVSVGALGTSLYIGTLETNDNWKSWNEMPVDKASFRQEQVTAKYLYDSAIHFTLLGSIKVKEFEDILIKLSLKRIRNKPLESFKIWIMRIPRLWYQFYIPMYGCREASGNFFIFYFVFAVYSFWKSRREEIILAFPIVLLFIYLTLIFLPLHIEPRYGVALMPCIISLAGIGIWKFVSLAKILTRKKQTDSK
ncbi:MAG: glycosyltransferase family 39 protein [Candidatus Omnitrophica bacterium]|jgi:4-amino-4-deoxy-L-arabinose transferase-like glycosyltransferase|nr:glycosyltransferase family 39 protein [Candidatus Omnitrophota bacterium]